MSSTMYNSYGQVSPPPEFSNNPFIDDPSSAHARFPDLNASSGNFQSAGYPSNGYLNQAPQYQPQYQSYQPQPQSFQVTSGHQYQAQPQMMSPQNQYASTSYTPQYPQQGQLGSPPTGISAFQHSTSAFAQPYPGYPYSGNGYPHQPQTQTTSATPSYLSEFDPYSQQSQQQSPQPSTIAHGSGQAGAGGARTGLGPNGAAHPRDLIRTHKSGLEAWDAYSWKQLLGACDALKSAWSARKQQAEGIVRQYGGNVDSGLFAPEPAFGPYNGQVEGWKQVLKDANNNFDTVAASTYQLYEVSNSYRHSGDHASKRRVRESCNAAIKGLPDWPSD